jgi:tetratricopeptide (TPR) repeat protein
MRTEASALLYGAEEVRDLMLDEGMRIELTTRLRAMNRVLDCIVPDSPTDDFDEAIEIVLKAVGRQEMTQAVTILEEVVNTNPFWLRGYLLLATIYQYVPNADQAIATTEKGLAVCASSLRLFSAPKWVEAVERISGPVVHGRIRSQAEQLRQYERMFRHRLAILQIRCGNFDEAIEQWSAIEEVLCA